MNFFSAQFDSASGDYWPEPGGPPGPLFGDEPIPGPPIPGPPIPPVPPGSGVLADFSGEGPSGVIPPSGAAPLWVDFSDASSGSVVLWQWQFGDGGVSYDQNPTRVYLSPGAYTVNLFVNDGADSSDEEIKADYVHVGDSGSPSGMEVDFVGFTLSGDPSGITPPSGDAELTVQFEDLTSGGPPTLWLWDFGDGATSLSQNPQHTYAATGVYDVQLAVRDESLASDGLRKNAYVLVLESGSSPPPPPPPPVVADFVGHTLSTDPSGVTPPSGEAPLTVQFDDLSTGAPTQWSWDFGDGGDSASQNPQYTYVTPGLYAVQMEASGATVDTELKADYVVVVASGSPPPPPAPVADFVGHTMSGDPSGITPPSGEAPLTVRFEDLSTGTPTSWSWTFGDGGDSAGENPDYVYVTPGVYTVQLTATNAGGSDAEEKIDYVVVTAPVVPPSSVGDDVALFLSGHDVAESGLSLYLSSSEQAQSGLTLVLEGILAADAGMSLFLDAGTPAATGSAMDLFAWGSDGSGLTAGLEMYLDGSAPAGAMNLFLAGPDRSDSSAPLPLYLAGRTHETGAGLDLFLLNDGSGLGLGMTLFASGEGTTPGAMPANASMNLFIQRNTAAALGMYLRGPGDPRESGLPLWLGGVGVAPGELSLFAEGIGAGGSTVRLYTHGF